MNAAPPQSWPLAIHEALPSTSTTCRELALAGAPEGTAVLARRQTAGRGRGRRVWESPMGNLYFSVLLRPNEPARQVGQFSLLAGVATVEALTSLLPPSAPLQVKWPNDVLLDGRKLAGILIDSSADATGGLEFLVIGIGVNVAVAPAVAGRAVTCLAEVIAPPPVEAVAAAILARLQARLAARRREGFAPLREAWLARGPALHSAVTLRQGDRRLAGQFAGLDAQGGLLLSIEGTVRAFATGEVLEG